MSEHKNFFRIKAGLNTQPALDELVASTAWNWLNLRRAFSSSCHQEVEDIVMRFAPIDCPQTFSTLMDGLDTVSYWTLFSHPQTIQLVREAFLETDIDMSKGIGRIVVSKLKPGAQVYAHPDEGDYAHAHDRYHVVVAAEDKCCEFTCGDETVQMKTGEFWRFSHELTHSVINNGKTDRINIIVDIRR